ncbi:GlxA family transcriptional regulator [Salininema proteolyticum]|uniref:GlxA family transcriptional regulator n=1 Tax=Salininema proteolyticum TaxID=1607685 RepID=A0ABV8TWM7_9ACTN
MDHRRVAVAVSEGPLHPWAQYELGVVASVFGTPQPDLSDQWYELVVCEPGMSWSPLEEAGTVFVPSVTGGCLTPEKPLADNVIQALRNAYQSGARMVGLCDGTFALAQAGLLKGRRVAVHWEHEAELRRLHPEVDIDSGRLFIDDGDIVTSAGMSAALDLSVHLVATDFGVSVANELARRLVLPPLRDGSHAQRSVGVERRPDEGIGGTLEWARTRLERRIDITDLARHAKVSPRTFFRRLEEATGQTPMKWLLRQRLAMAKELLESTALPVEAVARRCGLGTAANLRRHFQRVEGTSPTAYRKAFASAGSA